MNESAQERATDRIGHPLRCCDEHEVYDPDCARPEPAQKQFGSPEYIAEVREGLTRLRVLTDAHGFSKGAVMFLTGLSAAEVDELGGMTDA